MSVKSTREISSVSPGKNSSKGTVSSEKVTNSRPFEVRWVRICDPLCEWVQLLACRGRKLKHSITYILGIDFDGLPVGGGPSNYIFDLHHFAMVVFFGLRPTCHGTEKNPALDCVRLCHTEVGPMGSNRHENATFFQVIDGLAGIPRGGQCSSAGSHIAKGGTRGSGAFFCDVVRMVH